MKGSPKMWYKPEELDNYEWDIIQIAFFDTDIRQLNLINIEPGDTAMTMYKLDYKRVNLRNCLYPYVYVKLGEEELFKEMYSL